MSTQKTHLQRWAPQDNRTSKVRARSAITRDPWLRVVYSEALDALWEKGGELSADPAVLADELMCPEEEISRCLPILDEMARRGGRGGLLVENGRITNRRVTEELADELQFREEQAIKGGRGGRAKAAARRRQKERSSGLAGATPEGGTGQESASSGLPPATKDVAPVTKKVAGATVRLSPPAPAPAPTPTNKTTPPARTRANAEAPPGLNPLIEGRRAEMEIRALRKVTFIAEREGLDPITVTSLASTGWGKSDKVPMTNFASMNDERFARTYADLETREADLRRQEQLAEEVDPPSPDPTQPEADRAWLPVFEAVRRRMPARTHAFHTWFRPLRGVRLTETALVVQVPNPQFMEWLEGNYRQLLDDAAAEAAPGLAIVLTLPQAATSRRGGIGFTSGGGRHGPL